MVAPKGAVLVLPVECNVECQEGRSPYRIFSPECNAGWLLEGFHFCSCIITGTVSVLDYFSIKS